MTRCAQLRTTVAQANDAGGSSEFFRIVGLTAADEYRANMLAWRVACEIASPAECAALIERINRHATRDVAVRVPNFSKAVDRIFKDHEDGKIDAIEAISRFVWPFTHVCGNVVTAVALSHLMGMPSLDVAGWSDARDKRIAQAMLTFAGQIAAEDPLPSLDTYADVEGRIMVAGENTLRAVLAIWNSSGNDQFR